jgi:hypothetical protein
MTASCSVRCCLTSVLLGLTAFALGACDQRAVPGEIQTVEGTLCMSFAQSSPSARLSDGQPCAVDSFLTSAPSCAVSLDEADVRLCSQHLSSLTADIPWGARVELTGSLEEVETCSPDPTTGGKTIDAPLIYIANTLFVPGELRTR